LFNALQAALEYPAMEEVRDLHIGYSLTKKDGGRLSSVTVKVILLGSASPIKLFPPEL